jgi:hypothetical protein
MMNANNFFMIGSGWLIGNDRATVYGEQSAGKIGKFKRKNLKVSLPQFQAGHEDLRYRFGEYRKWNKDAALQATIMVPVPSLVKTSANNAFR